MPDVSEEHECQGSGGRYIVYKSWNPIGGVGAGPMLRLSFTSIMIPIHYCPFCGEDLESANHH